jgi:hypothetical protein
MNVPAKIDEKVNGFVNNFGKMEKCVFNPSCFLLFVILHWQKKYSNCCISESYTHFTLGGARIDQQKVLGVPGKVCSDE